MRVEAAVLLFLNLSWLDFVSAWGPPRGTRPTVLPPQRRLSRLRATSPGSLIVKSLLTYADLRPHNVSSPAGLLFLATNGLYLKTGLDQMLAPSTHALGALVEVAGLMSLWYHYSQLRFGPDNNAVRVALLFDYVSAWYAIASGLAIAVQTLSLSALLQIPPGCLFFSGTGVVLLLLSWAEGLNYGVPYMLLHGGWHLCSAYAASLFGDFIARGVS